MGRRIGSVRTGSGGVGDGHDTMTVTNTTVLEAVLRRDRMVLLVALFAVTSMAWIWILLGAGIGMNAVAMTVGAGMSGMAGMMMAPAAWTAGYAGLMFGMGWVQRARHSPAMGFGATRLALADDDDDELLALRRHPYRRRHLAIHTDQGHLPATLPLAAKFPGQGLAAWPAWRLPHGDRARHLLLGVLLVLDGPPVLRRRHEPVLDCWAGGVRPVGKGDPAGP